MRVLGIETSCDETAVAIVTDERVIEANIILSQLDEHSPYGGVVPEIAARAHLDHIDGLVERALEETRQHWNDINAIAATCGPGLIGGVMVGMMTAKALALALNKPFLPVNHLEGHALTARLTDDVQFPYLLLLASGGHTQIILVEGVGRYTELGSTIDDAAGEAFDKSAKLLGLGYPGGPLIDTLAQTGDRDLAQHYDLPRPLKGREGCDFSFAGLKTAVSKWAKDCTTDENKAALALALHYAISDVVKDRLDNALKMVDVPVKTLVVAGGVAANSFLRDSLSDFVHLNGLQFIAPPLSLCTDNAAMIAWAGLEGYRSGRRGTLDFKARPRWPLSEIEGT
ncbi:tRNA (adenosine(37)-N6)-threonylcarbamoyltransferase complex transferase subunit TsaD [Rubrivirga sp.]|uniref:tRNA (adenosine(37)-N6)-threonylcarbamoyltransferase complex transferase subunit TsaD n=1 Tax=Rubrivirga sp. TaxID=1885344 RepID=UPI003C738878